MKRWNDLKKKEQKSGYWFAVPDKEDTILDANGFEIVYVYYDGKFSVMRMGESKRESVHDFAFHSMCPITFQHQAMPH